MADSQRVGMDLDHNRAYFERQLQLSSPPAKYVLSKSFERHTEMLFQLGIKLRSKTDDDKVSKVETLVDARFQNYVEKLKKAKERALVLAKSKGVDRQVIKFSAPTVFTVRVTSPRANLYLDAIKSLDHYVLELNRLWLTGVITEKELLEDSRKRQKELFHASAEAIKFIISAFKSASAEQRRKTEAKAKAAEKAAGRQNKTAGVQVQPEIAAAVAVAEEAGAKPEASVAAPAVEKSLTMVSGGEGKRAKGTKGRKAPQGDAKTEVPTGAAAVNE